MTADSPLAVFKAADGQMRDENQSLQQPYMGSDQDMHYKIAEDKFYEAFDKDILAYTSSI